MAGAGRFSLLPFIEQRNVADLDGGTYAATNNLVAANVIPIFYCPSRRPAQQYGSANYGKLDYAANGGSLNNGTDSLKVNSGADAPFCRAWKTLPVTGATASTAANYKPDNKRNLAAITDGTSQTLMFSEKQMHSTTWGTNGGDNERWNNAGWDEDVVRFGYQVPEADTKHPTSADPTFWSRRFGSSHTAGVNVARCDASVSFAPYSVDAIAWLNFCKMNDGQVTQLDF